MEDSQIYEAELAYGKMYDDADFIDELRAKIDAEITQYLWSNSTEPHSLDQAEQVIEQYTGHKYDIAEYLQEFAECEDGMAYGVEFNPDQIQTFIYKLMRGEMKVDDGLELSSILAELVTQDVDDIINHHKEMNGYDGPDSDEGY